VNELGEPSFTRSGFAQKTHVEEVETREKPEALGFANCIYLHLTCLVLLMQNYFKIEIYIGRVLAINQTLTTDKLPTLYIKTLLRRQSYFSGAKVFRFFRQTG
jgi:hypothetical protein